MAGDGGSMSGVGGRADLGEHTDWGSGIMGSP